MIIATSRILILVLVAGAMTALSGSAQTPAGAKPATAALSFERYHSPQELNAVLTALNRANPGLAAIHQIGRSPGGRDLVILEVGPEAGAIKRRMPAVFVIANLEGTIPIASEGALFLAQQAIENEEVRKDLTWYILAAGNPDGAARYFAKPTYTSGRNESGRNDDMDDAADEDGPEDLDGNGIITELRVKDPADEWIPVAADPRLMKRADPVKGEKGSYKLYVEGIDNDGDGQYNEDGPGGTDISITFPHLFHPFTPKGGDWPGSEPETYAIMKFIMGHPEIAMTFTLGASNMCLQPPAGGRQGAVDLSRIKIPERYAKAMGVDPNATYSIQEVMDMVRSLVPPGTEVTEAMVSSMLGLGAVVNPLDEDLKYYKELSDRYKNFLKENRLDGKRLDPAQPKDGSFELWSYYQLGVPTFSMDFWTPPEIAEEKADQPPLPKPAGDGDPKMKALLAFSDKTLQGKSFVPWTPFKHPTLGEVDIGGAVPYAFTTPPPDMIKGLVEGQAPWIFKLAAKLPRMKILKTEVTPKGAGIYEVAAWIQNSGELPFPTAMGKRNRHVGPIVISLEGNGIVFLSGKRRTTVNDIDAMKNVKLTWLIQCETPQSLPLIIRSANAWGDSTKLMLGGAR